jgi:hypothetical protein
MCYVITKKRQFSPTSQQKPEIMHSTSLKGGYSTLRPEIRKTLNQESQTPFLVLLPPAAQGLNTVPY